MDQFVILVTHLIIYSGILMGENQNHIENGDKTMLGLNFYVSEVGFI